MKDYDLSQYMLRGNGFVIFPLTKVELERLGESVIEFERKLGLPYHSKRYTKGEIENISKGIDMENDYWFLDTLWVGVDFGTKSVVGSLRLIKGDNNNTVIYHHNENKCATSSRNDFLGLFQKFLEVNNFNNIVILKSDEEKYEGK